MKKICATGFRISNADQKALDNYLVVSPKKWAEDALAGLINKSIKIIMKDYFEIYKEKQTGTISTDYSVIIPAIIAMDEFKAYNIKTPEKPTIKRKEAASTEIWENGFDIEDYQKNALDAYFEDFEDYMNYLMTNKIFRRKEAFVKEHEQEFFRNKESIPAKQDDFINTVCNKSGYKTRKQQDEAFMAQIIQ